MTMYYLAAIPSLVLNDEINLIKSILEFEGHSLYEWKWDNKEDKKYIKEYYKGSRPVIVIRHKEFIDLSKNIEIVNGFWGLIEHLQKNGCIRC